jgi:hypothetical protein
LFKTNCQALPLGGVEPAFVVEGVFEVLGGLGQLAGQDLQQPNDLRIDVAERANVEAWFNAPPHQSELNGRASQTRIRCKLEIKG